MVGRLYWVTVTVDTRGRGRNVRREWMSTTPFPPQPRSGHGMVTRPKRVRARVPGFHAPRPVAVPIEMRLCWRSGQSHLTCFPELFAWSSVPAPTSDERTGYREPCVQLGPDTWIFRWEINLDPHKLAYKLVPSPTINHAPTPTCPPGHSAAVQVFTYDSDSSCAPFCDCRQ